MQAEISPLIAIVGPTGSGKSALSLVLAERFRGEIVGCDSIQVYGGLDVGSAKVPLAERRGIAHHLIDIIQPTQELTAGEYSRLARRSISEIQSVGRVPIVTGGTGFYLRALLDGLSPAPGRDAKLRGRLATLAERRPGALFRFMRRYDARTAMRIHPNDLQKLIRAVELTVRGKRPASEIQSVPRNALRGMIVLKLGILPDRAELSTRLNDRVTWMFSRGLLDETKKLLDAGYPPSLKPLQSVGYKQAVKVLLGEMRLDAAIAECQARTRQYAKRQLTWFRNDSTVEWLHGFGQDLRLQVLAIERVERFLADFVQKR